MIGYSFDYCLSHGLPGYDAWKTRGPDYDDEEPPEDDSENWSLEELADFFETHEPALS